jgi:hypothetical protein
MPSSRRHATCWPAGQRTWIYDPRLLSSGTPMRISQEALFAASRSMSAGRLAACGFRSGQTRRTKACPRPTATFVRSRSLRAPRRSLSKRFDVKRAVRRAIKWLPVSRCSLRSISPAPKGNSFTVIVTSPGRGKRRRDGKPQGPGATARRGRVGVQGLKLSMARRGRWCALLSDGARRFSLRRSRSGETRERLRAARSTAVTVRPAGRSSARPSMHRPGCAAFGT